MIVLANSVTIFLVLTISLGGCQAAEEAGKKGNNAFNGLVNLAVREPKWREKIKNVLYEVPIEGEAREKTALVFKEMGLIEEASAKSRSLELVVEGIGVTAALVGNLGILAKGMRDLFITLGLDQTAAPPATTPAPITTTTTLPPFNRVDTCCAPCCISSRGTDKVVCQKTFCPSIPSNTSECAEFPVCLPPCRLVVSDPPQNSDDLDDDFYERQKKKIKSGVDFFHMIMKEHCMKESLCKEVVQIFDSLPAELPKGLRKKLMKLMVYFRDASKSAKDRAKKELTSSQLVKGLIGNLFMKAMHRRGLLSGKKASSRHSSANRGLTQLNNTSPTVSDWEKFQKDHIGFFRGPFCPVCLGKCEQRLKDCEIDCANNPTCKTGKCVCT